MEPIESSETSAYNNTLTPGTYPKEKKLQYICWFDYYFQCCLFGSFCCFAVAHTVSPISLIYLLLLSWSYCSGLVGLSYLIRFIWLLWIGSVYCPDLASLISLDFIGLFFRFCFVCCLFYVSFVFYSVYIYVFPFLVHTLDLLYDLFNLLGIWMMNL
jgi:hypothetical protein